MSLLLVVPAYNEEKILKRNIKKLHQFLTKTHLDFLILIADNLSNDNTPNIGKELEKELKNVKYLRINRKGKGIAIKESVKFFLKKFDYFMFIDADLPTDLENILIFYEKLEKNKCDLVVGKRKFIYIPFIRKITSYGYKILANVILFFSFSKVKDFQAGIMAWNKKVAEILTNEVKDNHWFFNTELIYYSIKKKMKICYVEINCKIEKRSSIKVIKDSLYFLKKLLELRFRNLLK